MAGRLLPALDQLSIAGTRSFETDAAARAACSRTDIAGPKQIDGRLTVENTPATIDRARFEPRRAGDVAIRNNAAMTTSLLSALTRQSADHDDKPCTPE